jgi:hypothetical protein
MIIGAVKSDEARIRLSEDADEQTIVMPDPSRLAERSEDVEALVKLDDANVVGVELPLRLRQRSEDQLAPARASPAGPFVP